MKQNSASASLPERIMLNVSAYVQRKGLAMFNIGQPISWWNGREYWVHSARYVDGKEAYRLLSWNGWYNVVSDWMSRVYIDFHSLCAEKGADNA